MIVDFGFTWTINSTNTIQNQKSLAIRGAFLLTNSKLKHRNRWISLQISDTKQHL